MLITVWPLWFTRPGPPKLAWTTYTLHFKVNFYNVYSLNTPTIKYMSKNTKTYLEVIIKQTGDGNRRGIIEAVKGFYVVASGQPLSPRWEIFIFIGGFSKHHFSSTASPFSTGLQLRIVTQWSCQNVSCCTQNISITAAGGPVLCSRAYWLWLHLFVTF